MTKSFLAYSYSGDLICYEISAQKRYSGKLIELIDKDSTKQTGSMGVI